MALPYTRHMGLARGLKWGHMDTTNTQPQYVYTRTAWFYISLVGGIVSLLSGVFFGGLHLYFTSAAAGSVVMVATALVYLGFHSIGRLFDKEHHFYKASTRASVH